MGKEGIQEIHLEGSLVEDPRCKIPLQHDIKDKLAIHIAKLSNKSIQKYVHRAFEQEPQRLPLKAPPHPEWQYVLHPPFHRSVHFQRV